MRGGPLVAIAILASVLLYAPLAGAEPLLSVQPLQYREDLQSGERKKAFIDVSNPAPQASTVQFGVQGFRQIDDKGSLQFYDNEQLRDGIQLDYQEAVIPAYKTLRLYFVVDGSKLPTGDVFAVIFAKTKPEQGIAAPSVRLGTLVILTNGSPGAREARIEALEASPLQIGESLRGTVRIKNTAPASSSSGFFPEIKLSSWPFGPSRTLSSPLIYAGNTRTVGFDLPSSQLGIFKLRASYGDSSQERWIVLVTGVWRWVSVAVTLVIIGAIAWLFWRHRSRRSAHR